MSNAVPHPAENSSRAVSVESLVKVHRRSLRHAYQEGRVRYGRLPLSFEVFARRVIRLACGRLSESGTPLSRKRISEILERIAGADLFIAIACDERVEGSWEAFTERFLPRLKGLAKRFGASEPESESIAVKLPGDLAVPPKSGEARTRLGNYNGSGSLLAWLAVIVRRRLADRRRAPTCLPLDGDRDEERPVRDDLRDSSRAGADPTDLVMAAETAKCLEQALKAARDDLASTEALVLYYKFSEGLTQTESAKLLGVSEFRVSRTLKRALSKIRVAVERRFLESGVLDFREPDHLWEFLREAVAKHLQDSSLASDPLDRMVDEEHE